MGCSACQPQSQAGPPQQGLRSSAQPALHHFLAMPAIAPWPAASSILILVVLLVLIFFLIRPEESRVSCSWAGYPSSAQTASTRELVSSGTQELRVASCSELGAWAKRGLPEMLLIHHMHARQLGMRCWQRTELRHLLLKVLWGRGEVEFEHVDES